MDHNEIVASQPDWLLHVLRTLETFRFHPGDTALTSNMAKIVMVSDSVEVIFYYDRNSRALESAFVDASPKKEPPAHMRLFAQPGTPYLFEEVATVLMEAGFEFLCAPRGGSEFELRFARGQEEHQDGPHRGTPVGVYASLIWHR